MQKELDILGSRNATDADFDEVIAMLGAGGFPVEDAVSMVVPLEGAGEALARWSADPASMRKIMVEVGALRQQGFQLGQQRAKGAPAMAELVLVFEGNFGHRAAEFRKPEEWVVAEAAISARGG